jgi:phosphotransferase system enzyme I (PtsI)
VQHLKGLGVSPGVVEGRAVLLRGRAQQVHFYIPPAEVASELDRFTRAREGARQQLGDVKAQVARAAGPEHAYMFDAQLLMLDDPMLTGRAEELIRVERVNAEWALERAAEEIARIFEGVEDTYLRERKGDVADVVERLKGNLQRAGATSGPWATSGREAPAGGQPGDLPGLVLPGLEGPHVLVADELAPSVAAQVDWSRIVGFAADAGSWTYHTAILARSLRVPAVIGLGDASARILPGALVVMDGSTGEVVVDPPPEVRETFRRRAPARARTEAPAPPAGAPAVTADGIHIRLEANIELPDDVADARTHGAAGIGLYRSEYLLARKSIDRLDEDEQYETYRAILEAIHGRPADLQRSRGRLGLQAIRVSLAFRALFRRQLRALLRAARHGRLRIMFPFISSAEELREARRVVREARGELRERGEIAPEVPVGAMIEVPSAALTADLLARDADFLSIGTNDLIQCCLAVDRTDERVSHLYQPLHPAVLRLIRMVRRAAAHRRVPVSVCGEMAGDPMHLVLLIGLGLREFSMRPAALPLARRVVRGVRTDDMRRLAGRLLRGAAPADVQDDLRRRLEAARARETEDPVGSA